MAHKAVKIKDLRSASNRFEQLFQGASETQEGDDPFNMLMRLQGAMIDYSRELFEASFKEKRPSHK